jgi:hypothetical protein
MSASVEQIEQDQDPQEPVCRFCHDPLTDYSTCNLECNHIFHFRCVLIDVAAKHQIDQRSICPTCNEDIISTDMRMSIFAKAEELTDQLADQRNEHLITNQTDLVNHLMESSEQFRADILALKNKKKNMHQARKLCNNKINMYYTSFKDKVKDILLVLKGSHKEVMKNVMESNEYKQAISTSRLYLNSFEKIANKYNICKSYLLRRFHGRLARFYYRRFSPINIRWAIQRKFRIRIS